MTPHMLDFVRSFSWHAEVEGPVLEIGSYIEADQEHLNLRTAFHPLTPYLGVDVIDGPGVDRKVDLFDEEAMMSILKDFQPKVVLCLYVVEHVWKIQEAVRILTNMWRANPESWLWIATHQNQPYHGTEKYGDYWRLTASGLGKLMDEMGITDAKVFVLGNTSNPGDIVAIRQPISMSWPGEAMTKTVRAVEKSVHTPTHWEQYR